MTKQQAGQELTLTEALAKANRAALGRFGGRVTVSTGNGNWWRSGLWLGKTLAHHQEASSSITAVAALMTWMENVADEDIPALLEQHRIKGTVEAVKSGGVA